MSLSEPNAFPVDETTLLMLRSACLVDPETGRSHLHDFLDMGTQVDFRCSLGDGVTLIGYFPEAAPWSPQDAIVALIDEIERLRALG